MYAVIMAGGGGTRLHPLSRPERPKPFLPLTGPRTLLQMTVDRLTDLTDDITVVADGRYRSLIEDQVPTAFLLAEPMGRNTAVAVALATLALERPDDEVMLVLPADHTVADVGVFQGVLRGCEQVAQGALGVDSPLVTLGIQVSRPATEYGYLLPRDAGADLHGQHVSLLEAFEEKPDGARAEELVGRPGVAWNAGIFLWKRGAIRAAIERHTGLMQTLGGMTGSEARLQTAYEAIRKPVSIDYAVMEGAARNGQVVMGAMDVGWSDLGSWTALLAALGSRGVGAVVKPGETVEVGDEDLVIRRVDGRLGVIAPLERGSMTATQPIAVLRGTLPDIERVRDLIDRCAEPGG